MQSFITMLTAACHSFLSCQIHGLPSSLRYKYLILFSHLVFVLQCFLLSSGFPNKTQRLFLSPLCPTRHSYHLPYTKSFNNIRRGVQIMKLLNVEFSPFVSPSSAVKYLEGIQQNNAQTMYCVLCHMPLFHRRIMSHCSRDGGSKTANIEDSQ